MEVKENMRRLVANDDDINSEVAGSRNAFFLSKVVRSLCTIDKDIDISQSKPQFNSTKIISKGNDKDVGEGKSEKLKAHWTTSNKKLFGSNP